MISGSWVTCASFLLIMWISSHWSKYKAAGIAFPCLLCPNLCLQMVFCGPGLRHIPQILPHLACATHGPVRWDNELEKLAGATGGDAMPSHFTSKPKTPKLIHHHIWLHLSKAMLLKQHTTLSFYPDHIVSMCEQKDIWQYCLEAIQHEWSWPPGWPILLSWWCEDSNYKAQDLQYENQNQTTST